MKMGTRHISRHRSRDQLFQLFSFENFVARAHLVLGPVVEEQVDRDEDAQGDDDGLTALETQRLFCKGQYEQRKDWGELISCTSWGINSSGAAEIMQA